MRRIIRVIIQNSSYQNLNREVINNTEIRYLPDLFIFNLLSVYVLGETPYCGANPSSLFDAIDKVFKKYE